MKLVKQKTLYFSEGKSNKVYEVDLCENQDLFVVNFRYGRRDANLREGTKTIFPVSYEEALKIFNTLIESKEKKGYLENSSTESSLKTPKPTINSIREETILKYLKQAVSKTYTRNWKVSRIILRAGNLKMLTATSLIAEFVSSKDKFEQYNAIAVLASYKNDAYNHQILAVFKETKFTTIGGRIACAFLLRFGSESDKKVIKNEVSNFITEEVVNALPIHFLNADAKNVMLLYYAYIYAFEDVVLREKIYQLIEKIPFKANTFKSIRYIYRASEITNDFEFFCLLSKRMALNKPGYYSDYIYDSKNNWISVEEEKKKENPSIAFSKKTKAYFNSTSYKKLYELSQNNADVYISFASKILISLNDKEDNVNEDIQYAYDYNSITQNYESEQRHFPKYHNFPALMYILYGASARFFQQKNKWYYIEQAKTKNSREEILSNVWNEKPNEVLQILAAAKSDVAINFSIRIIEDNLHFLETISSELIAKLVGHYNPKVVTLIANSLEKKYADTQPEESIVIALLSTDNKKAVQLGVGWLEKYSNNYFRRSDFIISLLFTNQLAVIDYLYKLYESEVVYDYKIDTKELKPFFIKNTLFSRDYLVAINNLIGNSKFGLLLSETSANKITELSNSLQTTNKLFAINLAKHNITPAYKIFKDSFNVYITSDDELLRKAGIEILAHFPDDFLLENSQEIVGFCFSEYREVREAIQPTIERLVKLDTVFKNNLLNKLLQVLTDSEDYKGVHKDSYTLLTKYFEDSLTSLSEAQIFSFVLSKYEFAQNLGTPLFEKRIQLANVSMQQLVQLADSDVFTIREKVATHFKRNAYKVNTELEQALLIFNAEWQDVIDWACVYFDEQITVKNWTVDLLLYVCDNVKKEVQAFGIKMITKHFSNEKGLLLLQKLQEHPTKEMQFFVTNYLNSFAKDNPKVILQLKDYFKSSLFNINKNRATKTRVYKFLEEEAIKNEAVAKMTIEIINAVLDTKTITDKSRNIDILLAITAKFPVLEVPLLINEVTNEI